MLRRSVVLSKARAAPSARSLATTSKRRVFILDGHITPFIGKHNPAFIDKKHKDFGKKENPNLENYITNSVTAALKAAGVKPAQIQKGWIGNFAGELFSSQGHLGAALAGSHPDLRFLPSIRTEAACASGGVAFAGGVNDIRAGSDIVLVAGAEVQTTVSARQGGDYLARAAHYSRQRKLDEFTFPALFARRMKNYRTAHNVLESDIAHVSVKAYENGNKNPLAHMHAVKMTHEMASKASDKNPAFLGNEELKPWLKTSDCSQVSDGGAALVLVSEDGLKQLGKSIKDAVEVLSVEVAADNLYVDGDPLVMETTQNAAKRAFEAASAALGKKISPFDIQVAEVHDCFTIAEILMYEAIGWAKKGEGWKLAKDRVTTLDGKIPVNTGGGLVSFGHPVGATGIKQLMEVVRQMRGQCGDYQLKTRPTLGLTANMGGDDKTAVVSVLINRGASA